MVKGLLIWSHSYCRSTMAFYEGLAKAFNVPLRILFWQKGFANRAVVGHSDDEFNHLDVRFIGDDLDGARAEFRAYRDWHHIFGTYQQGTVFRILLLEAKKAGRHVAIASEAPCNMTPFPRALAKELFVSIVLRSRVAKHIQAASFIINFSGDEVRSLRRIGWPAAKIIPCGYYSPPLVGSACMTRTAIQWRNFVVLMTGRHEWHRDPMVLLKALRVLAMRGVRCKAVITQDGPLLPSMKQFAKSYGLAVEFVGLVPYDRLVDLYQECSCFVATGWSEPWGIRVNDALQCGAPLIVSDGMGAVKLVKDYPCGLAFPAGNSVALADQLESLIGSEERYCRLAEAVCGAADACHPFKIAAKIAGVIQANYLLWA